MYMNIVNCQKVICIYKIGKKTIISHEGGSDHTLNVNLCV